VRVRVRVLVHDSRRCDLHLRVPVPVIVPVIVPVPVSVPAYERVRVHRDGAQEGACRVRCVSMLCVRAGCVIEFSRSVSTFM